MVSKTTYPDKTVIEQARTMDVSRCRFQALTGARYIRGFLRPQKKIE